MQFIRNTSNMPSTIANYLLIQDQTVISCLFVRSANIDDNVLEWGEDFSIFNFEDLAAFLPENIAMFPNSFPEPWKKMFRHDQIGAGEPGYYFLATALKFTKGSTANKARFDMKGPQSWVFELKDNQYSRAYNLLPYTSVAKEKHNSFFYKERVSSTMQIVSPFENSTLEECFFLFNCPVKIGNVKDVVLVDADPTRESYVPVPSINIANTVASNGVVSGTITVKDTDGTVHPKQYGEVFLETTAGYLNKTRFVIGEDSSFKIRATDLEPSDTIKVKAGWRNYTGLSESIITVK